MLTHEASPIVAIRNKELDLAEQLAAARRAAEAELQSTRSLAAELCAEAELESRTEIESAHRAQIAQADEEAAQIVSSGERLAAQITFDGRQHMAVIIDHIVDFVLPPVRIHSPPPAHNAGVSQDCPSLAQRLIEEPAAVEGR